MKTTTPQSNREIWVDWMRVLACLMVITVHSTEPFYLGGDGSLILTRTDAFWASFFDSFVRACVPLFVVASSYLQFPLHYSAGEFFRRRAVRVLIPLAVWSFAYALATPEPAENLKGLLYNFNYAAGHLWFVYMLCGIYMIMPLLSPWAEKVGKKELLIYLAIWFATSLIPFVREALSENCTVIYGPTGIPRQAEYPLWGEASWNRYGAFYYVSGFIGYLLLGLYFRKFVGEMSWKKTLAIALPCWFAGFAICFGGFLARVFADAAGSFPIGGRTDVAVGWETPWYYDTAGVILMTVGWILLFRKVSCGNSFYRKIVLPVSQASYGMYLGHMFLIIAFSALFRETLGIGTEGLLGIWTTPLEIISTAVCTFVCAAVIAVAVRKIPVVGKYIMG